MERLKELILEMRPEKSDVIVWLQGDLLDRGQKVVELFQNKFAEKIIVTGNAFFKNLHPGEEHLTPNEMRDWLVAQGVRTELIMVDDIAPHTRAQAEYILELAIKNGWQKLMVVCSAHFQPRTFLTFLKRAAETGWSGKIICQDAVLPDQQIPGGKLQIVKEIMDEEVEKIKKYSGSLSTIEEGLKYFNKI